MTVSKGFYQLDERIQRWIVKQQWDGLRDIQERAIPPILNGDCDVIIAASTASGKTEAAFLPACSRIAERSINSVGILYISPLKALINDQCRRFQGLGEILDLPITPWHGDILCSVKNKQKKKPNGIILITPESLESLLLNNSGWCSQAFKELNYIILDEFHVFIGTERGCQLRSLLRRIEFLLDRIVPRIALSATLSAMGQVKEYLRPNNQFPCEIIESSVSQSDLKIQLRGYCSPAVVKDDSEDGLEAIKKDLYSLLRGKSHLVFANSRALTEELTVNLSDFCDTAGVPNEFFAHHGNLSKEIRESLENRLQQEKLPTTAVCTMTLELGIDIGAVNSIAQVTPPHSVASLRQRLGRSGRRGGAAILRMFITEHEITSHTHLIDRLRMSIFQSIAMINLLLEKWYEPPESNQYHLSTLVQQTLSVIGQYGGVRADQVWLLLCKTGPFSLVDQSLYRQFLVALGQQELISQTHDGQIILGHKGEKLVEHYTFYTAFNTPEEYRLECGGRILGSLPIDKPLVIGELIIFAGKRWEIISVNPEEKLILLNRAIGGRPPHFDGGGQTIHNRVRQEMFSVYRQNNMPIYLDHNAQEFFKEGIDCFNSMKLNEESIFEYGETVYLLPWLGDKVINTISFLLRLEGMDNASYGGIIEVKKCSKQLLNVGIKRLLEKPKPSVLDLASIVVDTIIEKNDHFLPIGMRQLNYGIKYFDINGAWKWLEEAKIWAEKS